MTPQAECRYPITSVSVSIGGSLVPLTRTNNNQWAYYNSNGPWQAAFPMPIQITNCLGETVTVRPPLSRIGFRGLDNCRRSHAASLPQ